MTTLIERDTLADNSVAKGAQRHTRLLSYVLAVVLPLAVLFIRTGLGIAPEQSPGLVLFVMAILLSAYGGGMGPGILATTISGLVFAFILFAPLHGLRVSLGLHVFQLTALLATGTAVSVLTERLRLALAKSRRSEKELRDSLKRLEQVLQVETVGVMFWDLNTGCMIDANNAFLETMGYSRAELERRELNWQTLTPPEYMEVSRKEVDKFLATGRVGPYEKEYFRKDGTRKWFLFAGSSLGNNQCVEFCVDISARKKIEQSLQESEQQFRALANAIPQLCWMANADGGLFWYNQRWYDYTGTTPDQMEGWGWQSVHDPAVLPSVLERWHASIQNAAPFEMVFPLLGADGQFRPFLTRVVPVKDSDGNLVRWFGTNTDISEQKQIEDALRESEERLELFIEHAPVALAMFDRNMRYVRASRRWMTDYGLGERDLYGISHYEIFPEIPERWKEAHRRGLSGEVLRCEEDALTRVDGTVQIIRWEIRPWRDKSGDVGGIVLFTEDITQRKSVEMALRQSKALLTEVGRIAKVGGWNFDALTGKGTWTEEVARIHDMDTDAPITMQDGLNFYCGGSKERITTAVREAIEEGKPYDLELELLTAKKIHKWIRTIGHPVLENGKVVRVYGSFQDISDLKRAEEILQKTGERLRRVTEGMTEGLVIAHEDGRRLFWNRAAIEMHGFSDSKEWQRRLPEFNAIFDLFTPEGETIQFENWPLPRILRGEELDGMEVRIRPKSGNWEKVFSYRGKLIEDIAGRKVAFVTILDITDRTRAEDELRKLNAELEMRVTARTSELEAANRELESFSYSVSHDLRAPLRAIDGFSKAVLDDYGPSLPEEGQRYLNTVRLGAKRMGELIDDLLAFSRLSRQPLAFGSVNMRDLVSQCVEELAPTPQDRKLDISVGDLPHCLGDQALLRQVWMNLLSNAIKFTSKAADASVEIGSRDRSGTVVYFVKDNGAGFDMKYADKLFGVFQRLHRTAEFEGTGVGLAIVQRILHRHGGQIWAEASPNQGATFYFTVGRGAIQ